MDGMCLLLSTLVFRTPCKPWTSAMQQLHSVATVEGGDTSYSSDMSYPSWYSMLWHGSRDCRYCTVLQKLIETRLENRQLLQTMVSKCILAEQPKLDKVGTASSGSCQHNTIHYQVCKQQSLTPSLFWLAFALADAGLHPCCLCALAGPQRLPGCSVVQPDWVSYGSVC